MRLRLIDRMPTPPGWEYRRWWWMASFQPVNPEPWAVRERTDGIALRLGRWIYMFRWRQPA